MRPVAQRQGELLSEWLDRATPAARAELLQFATGSSRMPHGTETVLNVDRQHDAATVNPARGAVDFLVRLT